MGGASVGRVRDLTTSHLGPPPSRGEEEKPFALDTKVAWLSRAEKAARRDRRIRQVRLTLGELNKNIAGLTPEGRSFSENRKYVTFVVQVTAEDGKLRQSGYEVMAVQGGWAALSGTDPAVIGDPGGGSCVGQVGGPSGAPGRKDRCDFGGSGGTLIHEAVGHSLEADAILDGSSPHFAHKIGKVVASEKISVWTIPRGPASAALLNLTTKAPRRSARFSLKTASCARTCYDRRSAKKGECPSNGHGRRESFAHRPIPRMSNTFIAPGPDDPQRILRELKEGLFVTRMGEGK
jgi:TldD protein